MLRNVTLLLLDRKLDTWAFPKWEVGHLHLDQRSTWHCNLPLCFSEVQLRFSFWSKCWHVLWFQLEKEALAKGVPVGQAIDIEISPPRPKRKPNISYPRRSGYEFPKYTGSNRDSKEVCAGSSDTHTAKQVLDSKKEPLPDGRCIPFISLFAVFIYMFWLVSCSWFQKSTGGDQKENN